MLRLCRTIAVVVGVTASVLVAPAVVSGHDLAAIQAQTSGSSSNHGALTPSQVAAYKQRNDTQARQDAALAAADAPHNAAKTAAFANGRVAPVSPGTLRGSAGPDMPCCGSGTVYIAWMYHYGQATNYFCGPAVVEEMSATVPGSSQIGLSQYAIASYMGTNGNGTGTSQEVAGLNHFVGVPDFGSNWYGFVGMSYNPTQAQDLAFINDLASDITASSPVAADLWEVAGGPHIIGHPEDETIFHWLEVGGYNSNSQIWYADSATSIWSGAAAHAWFSGPTLEIIMGGRGYIW